MRADVTAVARRLEQAGLTLATAESCTGGLLGAALTSVPGASVWYRGGVVVYSDDLKIRLAGVKAATLRSEGAVSPAVARELAQGARKRCGADIGVGITGVAGPGGGSMDKPVGTVSLALATATEVHDWTVRFDGDRDSVRFTTVEFALARIREALAPCRGVAD